MILNSLWNRSKYWLLIAAVVVVALYPLSFFQHIPKWDSVRGYLPYRFFISDYIQDGHLPLWNPFQRLGYPGYSDLQSGCWYPVVWLLNLLGQYDITSLNLEVVLTFLIAGWGMFTLSQFLHQCNRTAVILGISYSLSGCMVGSAQLMVFLIGMAWLPWILWSWLRVLRGEGARYSALLAFFLMCNITGASPAFTIVLMYMLPIMAVWYAVKSKERWLYAKRLAFQLMVVTALLLLLLAPFIVSFIDFMPYFNRTGKLPYEDMIINPFVWSDYLSFLFPYSVISTHSMFEVTDLSLRNAYIGLTGLTFFIASMFYRKNHSSWFAGLAVGGFMAMWLALGDYSGIYRITYHLPGFGLFRHPAFFRGYGLLCMLLLAGYALSSWLKGEWQFPKRIFVFALLGLLGVCAIAYFNSAPELIAKTIDEIARCGEFPSHGFSAQLFVNGALLVLLLTVVFVLRKFRLLSGFTLLLLFVVSDLFIQTRLTAPTTIYHAVPYENTTHYFEQLESLPSHDQSCNLVPFKMLDESSDLMTSPMLEKNISTYNRRISSVGENPLRFRAFDQAKDSGALAWILENPLMYFPTRLGFEGDSVQSGCIFGLPVHLDQIGSECSLQNPRVGYNSYSADITNHSEYSRWFVLNANYHHLWRAELNGQSLPITKVNQLAMGVLLPANAKGQLLFRFASVALPWAVLLSVIGLVCVVWIIYKTKPMDSVR